MRINLLRKQHQVPFYPVHHVWLSTKNLQIILKGKPHSLKRRSKYQSKFRYDMDVVVIRLGILTVISNSLAVQ